MNIGLNQPSNQKIEHFNSSSISSTGPWTFGPIKTLNVFIQDHLSNTMNICPNQTSNQKIKFDYPGSPQQYNEHLSQSKYWAQNLRITSATTMNAHSSRSHAIFTVYLQVKFINTLSLFHNLILPHFHFFTPSQAHSVKLSIFTVFNLIFYFLIFCSPMQSSKSTCM